MANIILAAHLIFALVIIGLVLMQQGKGSNMGASFGSGASNTVFGSRGNVSFLGRLTSILVALFFVTSLLLAWVARQEHQGEDTNIDQFIQGIEEKVQQDSLPVLEEQSPTDTADQTIDNTQ